MQAGPRCPGPPLRVAPVPRFASAIDDQCIAWFNLHALRLRDVLQLPAMYRLFLRHERLAAKTWDIQQHATGDDAVGPIGDRAKARTIKANLVLRGSPIALAVLVPPVAQRFQVC